MRDHRARRTQVGALALAVLLGGGLSACGGGEEDFGDESLEGVPTGGLNNEDVLADPAIVIDGIATIKDFVNEIMIKIGDEQAEMDNEAILPVWEDIEGRIKAEDPATHTLLETQFAALTTAVEKKDRDAARAAGNAIIGAFDAYLARARTASPTPAPSMSSSPTSTALPTSAASSSSTPTATATSTATTSASPTP